ncbi:MAG: DEAD/DEAH box helicase [Winkia neuii]|uniref:ATP-dependent helicase n=1 Tax=Winkia neuii TaxID=33007 RepID=A0A2I1IKX8_9ACTO|nr:DEAD/DEAH box helicase [Winkia neuii]OFJ71271.1 hypothetical protein HMPREF2851_08150 [Actinomyces sp. HMSC064C12]OFK03846.1 hypothetical protein HMPREF2835_04805 [Actinomyces sp. HMSC072A03]OFT56042.1 hypothetical protein HMPREF3152_02850 [Actinomyces sp. HMSC06A08]KWZ72767.1 protein, SNF2 family [Winkia neuii]MDK8100320.1 DEAD/DEAH box helicase [Winkia neuii]
MTENLAGIAAKPFEQMLAQFGAAHWQKGNELAGRIKQLEKTPTSVEGSVFDAGRNHNVRICVSEAKGSQPFDWECDCSEGKACAHVLALLLASFDDPSWQNTLRAFSATGKVSRSGAELAVCFDLQNRKKSLALRPLKQEEEGWSTRTINWRQIVTPSVASALRGVNTSQFEALRKLCRKAHLSRSQSELKLIDLGAGAVSSLRDLLSTGVKIFVGAEDLRPIKIAQGAVLAINITGGSDWQLQFGIKIGANFYSAREVWVGPGCALLPRAGLLVPLPELGLGPMRWLSQAKTVRIPATDVGIFRSKWLPALELPYEVISADSSVDLTAQPVQRIALKVSLAQGMAQLKWKLQNVWPEQIQEDELTEVPSDLQELWEQAKLIVPDINATALEIPQLALWKKQVFTALEKIGIQVELSDQARAANLTKREVKITFSGSSKKDWLDLSVQVKIGSQQIALPTLYKALDKSLPALKMPDGTWVDLGEPQLQELRSLLEEAKLLRPDEKGLVIPKADVGWINRARQIGDFEMSGVPTFDREIKPIEKVPGLRAKLRSYQSYGVGWLAGRMENCLGGILADDMGLGKTIQLLSAVKLTKKSGTVLVVAPTSVVSTWVSEAKKFLPDLSVALVQATERRRQTSLEELARSADILITTYTLVRLEGERYRHLQWEGLILDEAQAVKNSDTATFKALHALETGWCFAVTGTPIENSLSDLHSLTSLALPGLLPSARRFRAKVVLPVEKQGEQLPLQAVRARVEPHFLRRTKEEVATDLPPKSEQVLEVELNTEHRHLYQQLLTRERAKALGLINDPKAKLSLLAALTKIRLMALDTALVKQDWQVPSAKTQELVDQLLQLVPSGHKVLVFSQFTKYLKRVRKSIEEAGLKTSYLDGSTADRARVIEEFSKGPAQVFCISLRAGGTGLTLTEADYVFIMDPWWNPAVEEQAIDRAHRLGQTKPVNVYRLVAANTVEQKVMQLKEQKKELLGQVFGNVGASLDNADIAKILGVDN